MACVKGHRDLNATTPATSKTGLPVPDQEIHAKVQPKHVLRVVVPQATLEAAMEIMGWVARSNAFEVWHSRSSVRSQPIVLTRNNMSMMM